MPLAEIAGTPVPLSRASIWRWIHLGKFPKPIAFGGKAVFRVGTIREWLAAQGVQP